MPCSVSADPMYSSIVPISRATHVIFDFDGLLVDTEPHYTIANSKMLAKFGKEFTMDLKKGQMGRKKPEAIRYILEQTGLTDAITIEDYAKEYDEILFELHKDSPAKPGAERLVRHLESCGIPLAICSGSDSEDFPIKSLMTKEWIDLIPIKVLTGSDPSVKRGKPHPDGFLETMSRFPVQPESPAHVLVFEDAPNGVRAALAAGMQCVMVPDPLYRPDPEFASTIHQVLDSLEEFRPEVFGLPPYVS